MKSPNPAPPARRLRHRVMVAGVFVFGPGKADILAGIRDTGSLAAAARGLRMSYMRAWTLVQEMNSLCPKPLVQLHRGGKTKGGASLTPTGEKALSLYLRMESDALAATESTWKQFRKLLKPSGTRGARS